MVSLQTQRLILRPFQKDDVDDFYNYAKHPEVGPKAGWPAHTSRRESKRILEESMLDRPGVFAIEEKETNTVIGSISYQVDGLRVSQSGYFEIGYALGKQWWGKGYMTEAVGKVVDYLFRTKKAVLLTARRSPANHRSARVIEKTGFRYVGTLRQTAYTLEGKIRDTVFYSMTYPEYLAHLKVLEQEDAVKLAEE